MNSDRKPFTPSPDFFPEEGAERGVEMARDNPSRPAAAPISLITFSTLLDGQVTETAEQAYSKAVDLAVHALDVADARPEDAAEPMHDALARFSALSAAGMLKVIS